MATLTHEQLDARAVENNIDMFLNGLNDVFIGMDSQNIKMSDIEYIRLVKKIKVSYADIEKTLPSDVKNPWLTAGRRYACELYPALTSRYESKYQPWES